MNSLLSTSLLTLFVHSYTTAFALHHGIAQIPSSTKLSEAVSNRGRISNPNRPTLRSAQKIKMGLTEWLRGGGPAKRRRLDEFGVQLSSTAAAGLTLLSFVSVGFGLPWEFPGMAAPPLTGSYWLTRIVFLRGVAFIYLVAFAAAFHQNIALIGDNGLLPARLYLRRIREAFQASSPRAVTWGMLWAHPTLLWFAPPDRLDPWLRGIAACGAAVSAAVLLLGASNMPIQLALWALYHSIVTVGQRWYSFGWESQVRPPALARPPHAPPQDSKPGPAPMSAKRRAPPPPPPTPAERVSVELPAPLPAGMRRCGRPRAGGMSAHLRARDEHGPARSRWGPASSPSSPIYK